MTRAWILLAALAACGEHGSGPEKPYTLDGPVDAIEPDGAPGGLVLANMVIAAPGGGDTSNAVDGVQGGGAAMGSVDVYSLGYTPDGNDSITLGWLGGRLANGQGDDFAVFENPFSTTGGVFMDLVIVEVSRDGQTWRAIDHAYTNPDETVYVRDPAAWRGFAGRTPVLLNVDTNPVDPFDRAAAGGDGFDLDDVLGDDPEASDIRRDGVQYIRLVSAPARINPDTGATYVHDAVSNGADIDGVYGRYVYWDLPVHASDADQSRSASSGSIAHGRTPRVSLFSAGSASAISQSSQ